MTKPVAERISKWDRHTEIIYRCRKCDTSFATLGNHVKYCYNCGEKQDWNVAGMLKQPFVSNNYEEEQVMIAEINRQNDMGKYEA